MGRNASAIDWINFLLIIVIACFGLFLLLTIRQQLFVQQLLFLVVGVGLAWILSRIDGTALQYFSGYLYVASLILLASTYLISPDIRGAARWIVIGSVQIQPSELVKPFLLFFFATSFRRFSPRNVRNIPLHIALFILPFLLVFKQPDLGSAIVYLSFWGAMIFAAGVPFLFLILTGIAGVVFIPFFWSILAPFQRLRLETFLNPGIDPRGAGYNAFQAMIAVGSGQLFGRGLGRGTQSHLRFLPEFHTDFIFATLIEELGFVGGMLLFFLYGLLLWRMVRSFLRFTTHDTLLQLYSIGLFTTLLTQIIVNSGMNMGIIPITGITLPLVSYGGSSILSICMSFGILWSLRRSPTGQTIAIS